MAVKHKVSAAAAVVRVGGTERYLYQGAVVPAGVSEADLARLTKMGLITPVPVAPAAAPAEPAEDTAEDLGAPGQEPADPARPARARGAKPAEAGDSAEK